MQDGMRGRFWMESGGDWGVSQDFTSVYNIIQTFWGWYKMLKILQEES